MSEIFVIPKSSGGFRPIANLKGLNKFAEHQHFKMEGLNVLKDIVRIAHFLPIRLERLTRLEHSTEFGSLVS